MKQRERSDRPSLRPVRTIELSDAHTKLRLALLIVCLAVAAAALACAVNSLISTDAGLQEIEAYDTGELSSADEFTFYYEVGMGELSATEEYKALRSLYTQAAQDAYELLSAEMEFDGCSNIWYLNQHVGEAVTVDGALYQALSAMEQSGARYLYLAPVYELYQSMLQSQSDYEADDFDPYENETLADFCAQAAAYLNDPEAIDLELLGDNTVILHVSEGYLRFGQENGITRWIDFFWLKNAFAADLIAQQLIDSGYTRGMLISGDGFVRGLGEDIGTEFSLEFPHREGLVVTGLATLSFSGSVSLACLRDYPLEGESSGWYYVREDGQIRTRYVDTADGLCKSALPELVVCSTTLPCGETALLAASLFIADSLDPDLLHALTDRGAFAYYYDGDELICTQPEG